ncbi:hypothetical protein EDD15DRAFT_2207364 [Pisolithus albus]|nr:hypothetical protein EDD15DRAFT_2207364 [Pisolithus albus]
MVIKYSQWSALPPKGLIQYFIGLFMLCWQCGWLTHMVQGHQVLPPRTLSCGHSCHPSSSDWHSCWYLRAYQ